MKRLLWFAFGMAMAVAATGFAEPPQPRALQPGEAITGRFVQERHLAGLASPLRSEGSFLLSVGRGLIWRGEKPFATTVVITPAGILQLVNGSEVQRVPSARLPFLAHFYDMLSGALAGDWTAMEHDFIIDRKSEAQGWNIALKPRHPDDPVAAQLQSISISGVKFVDAVEIRRASGDWERLTFQGQALSSAPLAPEDAQFFDRAGQ